MLEDLKVTVALFLLTALIAACGFAAGWYVGIGHAVTDCRIGVEDSGIVRLVLDEWEFIHVLKGERK